LPQAKDEALKYLQDLAVPIGEVHQTNLASLGVEGTPSLILADKNGTVTDLWVGKLGGKSEGEFLRRLELQEVAKHFELSPSDLKRLLKSKNVVAVDVDNRDLYRLNHVDGAVNIPLDELEVRAPNELVPTDTVVVYCHICESDGESEIARGILLRNGFTQVSVLKGGLKSWESETPQRPPANKPPDSVNKKAAGSTR
jgi:rhodanese-related sulfurtransferase